MLDLRVSELWEFSHALHFLASVVSTFVFWLHSFLFQIACLHIVGNTIFGSPTHIFASWNPKWVPNVFLPALSGKKLGGLWLARLASWACPWTSHSAVFRMVWPNLGHELISTRVTWMEKFPPKEAESGGGRNGWEKEIIVMAAHYNLVARHTVGNICLTESIKNE